MRIRFGTRTAGEGRARDPRRPARGALVLLALLVVAAGGSSCGRRASREQLEAARQARAQKLIESGNEAYRMGDYRLAARRYAAAAVVKQNDPAAYFGMGMALSKLGRDEEARAAYAHARELARRQAVLDWPGTRGRRGSEPETVRAPRSP